MIVRHNVCVATDDPVSRVAQSRRSEHRIVGWNECHELTLYFFNPTDADAYHPSGSGEGGLSDESRVDYCFERYDAIAT
jgi:hypothetical protein